ncbi:MAG: hypothetical protein RIB45_13720 [Marivibrio sp.]|uniref:hypothetical protein n=1 Tax=Marivibrio sp. TaxID=2039719 RepID=UPI0032EF1DB2
MTRAEPRLLRDAATFQSAPCRRFAAWLGDQDRDDDAAPKSQVDPHRLRDILPHLMLMAVEPADAPGAPPRLRYTLVGEHIAEYYEPLKGRYVDELELGDWRDYWLEAVRRPARERLATCGVCSVEWQGRDHLMLEYVFAPVVRDGTDEVVQLVCCVSFFYESTGKVMKATDPPFAVTPPQPTPVGVEPDP